jgi:hypothetical protein
MVNGKWALPGVSESCKKYSLLFLAVLVLIAAGCGGSVTSSPTAPAVVALNGNFSITTVSQTTLGRNIFAGGLQTDSAGHVAGIVHVAGTFFSCFGIAVDLPLAGSVESTGRLSATVTSPDNQVIALSAQVNSDGATISGGTYTASGTGCAAGDHGTATGFQVQPFTGTYSGTYILPSGTIQLTMSLIQATMPDAHGTFQFAPATVTVSGGNACGMAFATLNSNTSLVSGGAMVASLTGSDGVTSATLTGVTLTSSTTSLTSNLVFITGLCAGQTSSGTLARD